MTLRALVSTVTLLLFACGGGAGEQSGDGEQAHDSGTTIWAISQPDRSVSVIDAESARILARIRLGFRSDPRALVHYRGSVWVGSSGGALQRLDTRSLSLADTFALDMDVWALAAAEHGLYAMDAEYPRLTRHDPVSGERLQTHAVAGRIHAMAAGSDAAVLVLGDRRELHLYHPGVTEPQVVPGEPGAGDMVSGFGSLWIYHPDGALVRLDATAGTVQARIELPPDLYFPGLAVGEDALWVSVMETSEVLAVSPAENTVMRRIGVTGSPGHLAATPGALWVALPQDDALVRIDAVSGEETARVGVEYATRLIAVR